MELCRNRPLFIPLHLVCGEAVESVLFFFGKDLLARADVRRHFHADWIVVQLAVGATAWPHRLPIAVEILKKRRRVLHVLQAAAGYDSASRQRCIIYLCR